MSGSKLCSWNWKIGSKIHRSLSINKLNQPWYWNIYSSIVRLEPLWVMADFVYVYVFPPGTPVAFTLSLSTGAFPPTTLPSLTGSSTVLPLKPFLALPHTRALCRVVGAFGPFFPPETDPSTSHLTLPLPLYPLYSPTLLTSRLLLLSCLSLWLCTGITN